MRLPGGVSFGADPPDQVLPLVTGRQCGVKCRTYQNSVPRSRTYNRHGPNFSAKSHGGHQSPQLFKRKGMEGNPRDKQQCSQPRSTEPRNGPREVPNLGSPPAFQTRSKLVSKFLNRYGKSSTVPSIALRIAQSVAPSDHPPGRVRAQTALGSPAERRNPAGSRTRWGTPGPCL